MSVFGTIKRAVTRRPVHYKGRVVGSIAACTEEDGIEQGFEWTAYDAKGDWWGFYSTPEDAIAGAQSMARAVGEPGRHRY